LSNHCLVIPDTILEQVNAWGAKSDRNLVSLGRKIERINDSIKDFAKDYKYTGKMVRETKDLVEDISRYICKDRTQQFPWVWPMDSDAYIDDLFVGLTESEYEERIKEIAGQIPYLTSNYSKYEHGTIHAMFTHKYIITHQWTSKQ